MTKDFNPDRHYSNNWESLSILQR